VTSPLATRRMLAACALVAIGSAITAVVFLILDHFRLTPRNVFMGALAFTLIGLVKLLRPRSGASGRPK
jgi:hypothetical protein